jgi:hypothetical protein
MQSADIITAVRSPQCYNVRWPVSDKIAFCLPERQLEHCVRKLVFAFHLGPSARENSV